jgi:hypothetical protein
VFVEHTALCLLGIHEPYAKVSYLVAGTMKTIKEINIGINKEGHMILQAALRNIKQ